MSDTSDPASTPGCTVWLRADPETGELYDALAEATGKSSGMVEVGADGSRRPVQPRPDTPHVATAPQ